MICTWMQLYSLNTKYDNIVALLMIAYAFFTVYFELVFNGYEIHVNKLPLHKIYFICVPYCGHGLN